MKMNKDIQIGEILERHKRWLNKSEGWSEKDRAVLCRMDLSYADFSDVDLSGADLSGANLYGADLTRASMIGTDMTSTILSAANLTNANFKRANLLNSNMHKADVTGTNLYGVNLHEANLTGVHLENAVNVPLIPITCPEKGAFIGWKRVLLDGKNDGIAEIEIQADATRSSATGRKCRCSKAKVISITDLDGKENFTTAKSAFDDTFVYTVGQTVSVGNFDDNRWNECSTGIHFYITRQEAVNQW